MTVDRIGAQPLFAGLPAARLEQLAAVASERVAAPDEVLVERGQPASGLFVLEEGRLLVEVPGGASAELAPGDVFGEFAFVGLADARTARVRALAPSRCLAFARSEIERLLADEPAFGERLRAVAEQRVAGRPSRA